MSWYRTGTISVTNGSASVTGAGTSWIANSSNGEALLGPDGKLYEISNISSNTSLTLGSVYLGSTQSAQSYVIVPSQSYIRDLATQASILVTSYSSLYNTIGQGKFLDGDLATPGISFSTDTNTGFYHSAPDEVTLVAGGVAIAKWSASGFTFLLPGSFVDLSSSGVVSGAGFNNYLASPPAIGSTAPNTGKFTTVTTTGDVTNSGTGAQSLHVGTTAQRPANGAGKFRYNSDHGRPEYNNGTTWKGTGGASGGGGDDCFYENSQVVTTDYTLTSGKNGMSAGPITVASGVTLVIPAGSTYVVV